MYFVELLVKCFKKKQAEKECYNPLNAPIAEEDEFCEHIFMPIDSTGEILACSLCGMVVNKKDLKKHNIFKNKVFKR